MNNLLVVEDLRVTYGGVTAVDDVDLTVDEGEIVGLIGPNGAGKTSTDRRADRLPRAGRRAASPSPATTSRGCARTCAPAAGSCAPSSRVELFDDLTVEENLLVASQRMGVAVGAARPAGCRSARTRATDVAWALELCGLDRRRRTACPTELSHGRRKLVGVARALASARAWC